jgi:hypothetical protein
MRKIELVLLLAFVCCGIARTASSGTTEEWSKSERLLAMASGEDPWGPSHKTDAAANDERLVLPTADEGFGAAPKNARSWSGANSVSTPTLANTTKDSPAASSSPAPTATPAPATASGFRYRTTAPRLLPELSWPWIVGLSVLGATLVVAVPVVFVVRRRLARRADSAVHLIHGGRSRTAKRPVLAANLVRSQVQGIGPAVNAALREEEKNARRAA